MLAINPFQHFLELERKLPIKTDRDKAAIVYKENQSLLENWFLRGIQATGFSAILIAATPYFIGITALFFTVTVGIYCYSEWQRYKKESIDKQLQACVDAAILCDIDKDHEVGNFFAVNKDIIITPNIPENAGIGVNATKVYEFLINHINSKELVNFVDQSFPNAKQLSLHGGHLEVFLKTIVGINKEFQNNTKAIEELTNKKGDAEEVKFLKQQCERHLKTVHDLFQKVLTTNEKYLFEIHSVAKFGRFYPPLIERLSGLLRPITERLFKLSPEELPKSDFSFGKWMLKLKGIE